MALVTILRKIIFISTFMLFSAAAVLPVSADKSPAEATMSAENRPVLGTLVQEIVLLRQINSLELNRKQIEGLLPPMQNLLSAQKEFVGKAQSLFMQERNGLARGDLTEAEVQALRRELNASRKRLGQVRSDFGRDIKDILTIKQAAALHSMIATPMLHRQKLSEEEKQNLRRRIREFRQLKSQDKREQAPQGIREGGCVVNGKESDKPRTAPNPRDAGLMTENSKRLELIITLLKEKLTAVR